MRTKAFVLAGMSAFVLVAMAYVAYRYLSNVRTRAYVFETRWERLRHDPASIARYRNANARLRTEARVPGRVVFLGASVTEGMDLEQLFPGEPYVNRGIGGQLLWQEYLRFPDDVVALQPAEVIPEVCATNFEDGAPSMADTQLYLARLEETARANGIRPVLATVIPVSRAYAAERAPDPILQRIHAMNAWIRSFARSHGDGLVDYAEALSDGHGYLPDALTDDGLHPNALGYARMADAVRAGLASQTASQP